MINLTHLVDVAKDYIAHVKTRMETRGPVETNMAPTVVTVSAEGRVAVHQVHGKTDATQRFKILQSLVAGDEAVAVLFLSDINMRDPQDMHITKEALAGFIESKDGQHVAVMTSYTRTPLTFDELLVQPGGIGFYHGDLWGRKEQAH